MATELVPPKHLIKLVGGGGAEGFAMIGQHCLDLIVTYGALKSTDRVLEVGCGCGRVARPLTGYLASGSYEGFDVVLESIKWCQDNITQLSPRFRFRHADVFNSFYNPNGKLAAKDFRFPYPDNSFDFTLLTSVFTHMLPDDVAHYSREIARTLKPRGTALITFFILNEESQPRQFSPESTDCFPNAFVEGQCFVSDPARPEALVAYVEEFATRLLTVNGLRLQEPIYPGYWCGRKNGVTLQDLAICTKA